jgi:hypothetical protein
MVFIGLFNNHNNYSRFTKEDSMKILEGKIAVCCCLSLLITGCLSQSLPTQVSGGAATVNESAGLADEKRFYEELETKGFIVQKGMVNRFTIKDCANMPTCFAANATSPYLLFSLPPFPGVSKPTPAGAFELVPGIPKGMSPTLRLREDEAVVIYGRTPPKSKYFSIIPYVFVRFYGDKGSQPIFASASDATNNVNIKTSDGGPFNASTVFIIVSDKAVESSIRKSLIQAGFNQTIINTIVVSPQIVKLGLSLESDILMMLGRIALFEDTTAGEKYLNDPPLNIFRVTPREKLKVQNPIPAPIRKKRAKGNSESIYLDAINMIESNIRKKFEGNIIEEFSIASFDLITECLNPDNCLSAMTRCNGEVSDTVYAVGPMHSDYRVNDRDRGVIVQDNDLFVVFGVNHEAAGRALYSSAVIGNSKKLTGFDDFTSLEMKGSAEEFLPNHPLADKLYAWKVARNCDGIKNCAEIPEEFPGVARDEPLYFVFRAYVQPGSDISPDPSELITDRVIRIRKR